MRVIADFHIHSPYSRAVSREMTLENLDYWARLKGISVIATGDFVHPKWTNEISEKLEPAEPGLFRLRKEFRRADAGEAPVRFMLTVEISNIYTKNKKARRIHNLIFVPTIEAARKIGQELGWRGNISSDGRPILGLDSKELLKIVLDSDPESALVPAHAWTPWFSVFGSMSGFDSLEECFDEMSPHIFAIETGLSSDPAMNRRLSKLDKIALISNSDSHSLQRIGREANVFECDLSYASIMGAIRSNDPARFLFTVEFFPEEGRYHYDGHAQCKVRWSPEETKAAGGKCPVCGRKVTVGVMSRVDELSDRPAGKSFSGAVPFKSFIPLDEIIGEALDLGVSSKKVKEEYARLVREAGSEFAALADLSDEELRRVASPIVAEGVRRVRGGEATILPGYDGEYGAVKIFEERDREKFAEGQASLFG